MFHDVGLGFLDETIQEVLLVKLLILVVVS